MALNIKKGDYLKNIELKTKVIHNGLCIVERKLSRACFDWNRNGLARIGDDPQELYEWYEENFPDEFHEAHKINHAQVQRRVRLAHRIKKLLQQGTAYFVTLTFRDDILESTSKETRRRYVTRYLKKNCSHYVANVDYSPQKHREHYHAVVIPNESFFSDDSWSVKCGFTDVEKIRSNDDYTKLAKYVIKLVNHAMKESTDTNYCIYSR